MMKYYLYILLGLLLCTSCRPVKKIQKIDEAISKKDTMGMIVVQPSEKNVDSTAIAKNLLQKLSTYNLYFTTFSARVKVEFETKEGSDQGTANIRMRKDSIIWISLTGPLNIEGYRLLITKDSVVLMNKLKNWVQYKSINYLQEITDIPFDFTTLQDFIVGNPIFIDSSIASYKVKENETLILMMSSLFKHLITLDNNSLTVLHSKLDDIDAMRNRTCDITYSSYENLNGIPFSTKRHITVAENNRLNISMDFKKYELNPDINFPFNIPKNYQVK